MKRSMMSNYYSEQESLATEFANGSGLPFVYHYTGGGCDAIYGETGSHRIYITSDASVPNPDEVHYVGVYLVDNDDLVGECWAANRGELLEFFQKFSTLEELASELVIKVVVNLNGFKSDDL
jgi:hypothetical protein